jgi:hypothetical protein
MSDPIYRLQSQSWPRHPAAAGAGPGEPRDRSERSDDAAPALNADCPPTRRPVAAAIRLTRGRKARDNSNAPPGPGRAAQGVPDDHRGGRCRPRGAPGVVLFVMIAAGAAMLVLALAIPRRAWRRRRVADTELAAPAGGG